MMKHRIFTHLFFVFLFERTYQIEQKYHVCTKIISSTEENCFQHDNNEKCLSIRMIYEGSRDTEDWTNGC